MGFRDILAATTATLPYKRRLSYLESTGTQHIDTGVILSSAHSWELDFAEPIQQPQSIALTGMFGARAGTYTKAIALHQNNGGATPNIRLDVCVSTSEAGKGSVGFPYAANVTNIKLADNKVYINRSETAAKTFGITPFTCDNTAHLFSARGIGPKALCKLKYCKIWGTSKELVRFFIPVLWAADKPYVDGVTDALITPEADKPGMFDKVSGKFFTNRGTGEFLYA